MTPKQIEDYYDRLARQGKAEFKLIFKSAPNDEDFAQNDPLAEVTITATDPATGKVIFTQTRQMSPKAHEAEITISVLSVRGVFKKAWDRLSGKDAPKPSKIAITVRPHKEWEQYYEPKDFPLEARIGRNPPVHVWMPAKPRPSRLLKIDKPTNLPKSE